MTEPAHTRRTRIIELNEQRSPADEDLKAARELRETIRRALLMIDGAIGKYLVARKLNRDTMRPLTDK